MLISLMVRFFDKRKAALVHHLLNGIFKAERYIHVILDGQRETGQKQIQGLIMTEFKSILPSIAAKASVQFD